MILVGSQFASCNEDRYSGYTVLKRSIYGAALGQKVTTDIRRIGKMFGC